MVKLVSQDRVQQRITELAPVPQCREEILEVEKLHPFDRVQQRTVEAPNPQTAADIPVPPAMEEMAAVASQERDHARTAVQKVDGDEVECNSELPSK